MHHLKLVAACCLTALALTVAVARGEDVPQQMDPLPMQLSGTGLYVAGSTTEVHPDNIAFSPQYPLWSDGATKRRWLHIPRGRFIDASQPDTWEFPHGTKLWKEFSHGGRVETRLIERLNDGSWRYATYVWDAAGTKALRAPAAGIRALQVASAPGGRYAIPSEPDCRACHEGAAVPVLGVSALQLSPDRDPLAPHAEPRSAGDADLYTLVARGWLRNLPAALRDHPPRVSAPSPVARAALGYLHGNCGHCHSDTGSPPPVPLLLSQSTAAGDAAYAKIMRTLLNVRPRYRTPGLPDSAPVIDAGHPGTSVLAARMRSRDPRVQMPPIATQHVDDHAIKLIERWIQDQPRKEPHP